MPENNPKILFKKHFKIYVLPKDKIKFESEIVKQRVEYYCDIENQSMFENGIRYFIQDIDRIKLDEIFIKNEIIAHTETIFISDYRDEKKIQKMYFNVAGIMLIIMILTILLDSLLR
ncbi:hypothetical protein [Flavobacterium sp.]|uniref:hypothetical protein n=1 Tax=Flavobacterium sp. TaxID=239 RepID=UPI0040473EBE